MYEIAEKTGIFQTMPVFMLLVFCRKAICEAKHVPPPPVPACKSATDSISDNASIYVIYYVQLMSPSV